MISDSLSTAVDDIDYYLDNPTYKDVYSGRIREKLKSLRDNMNSMRVLLDKVPPMKKLVVKRAAKKKVAKKSRARKT
jgi:hypothetical protein